MISHPSLFLSFQKWDPPDNMAIDEYLFRQYVHQIHTSLILRFYGWNTPTFTIGYFQDYPYELASTNTVIRRITGGGIVDHRQDLTFSLIFPCNHPLFGGRDRTQSYYRIHATLIQIFQAMNIPVELFSKQSPISQPKNMECFLAPVLFDIMYKGKKVCGGAQRRDRNWILHQGSICLNHLPSFDLDTFIENCKQHFLGNQYETFSYSEKLLSDIRILSKERYMSPEWNLFRQDLLRERTRI